MANKKLKVGGGENLKLPVKRDKSAPKKPKWQAKTGGVTGKRVEDVVETPEVVTEQPAPVEESATFPPEPTETPVVATTPEGTSLEPATVDEAATVNDAVTPTELPATDEAAPLEPLTADEPAPKKPRKLKVKNEAPPKKLSMVAAALQVLQDRQDAMTCPELIDVMATEGLWVSPSGKTPANTLYAAISRIIKEQGKASAFRKAERGRFEAKVLPKE